MRNLQNLLRHTDVVLGLGLLAMVAMLIFPLPYWILDTSLVFGLATSVMILLTSISVTDPLQFSIFPSLLLITTLFRLALSIAATKLILGAGAAGKVIETFGNVIMGGNFVVGFVAFLILSIVQFLVITNGTGRVAEVVARFILDAMPGKQMAIDADLAAGLIDENVARTRRKQIKQEADFYGAMDGATKFVKGDAIASILIVAVNVIGGFIVGSMRGEGDIMNILRTYSLLSVGEGLVSQIPALLISTASGLLVTRAGQETNMGGAVMNQLINQPKAMLSAGITLICFSLIPGFPKFIFLSIGIGLVILSRAITKNNSALEFSLLPKDPLPEPTKPMSLAPPTESILPLLGVDPLEIEMGYGLTHLADIRTGGNLTEKVSTTRQQIALELGFVMPSVRLRDSLALNVNEYVIKVRGEEIARSEVHPDMLLVISNGITAPPLEGIRTKEPAFGLDAVWVDKNLHEQIRGNHYTIIEPTTVIVTHLSEIIKAHAAELLSRQDVQILIENIKNKNITVVEELIPNMMHIGDIQKVLQHLLRERVPIKDMGTILESLADFAPRIKEPEQLGELVRSCMVRTITRQYLNKEGKLCCLTLEPALEKFLSEQVQESGSGSFIAIDPREQLELINQMRERCEKNTTQNPQVVILCSSHLRLPLRHLTERYLPNLPILAYNEVSPKAQIEFLDQLRVLEQAATPG